MTESNVRQLTPPLVVPESHSRSRWRGRYPRGVTSLAAERRRKQAIEASLSEIDQEIADAEQHVGRLLGMIEFVRGEVQLKLQARARLLRLSGRGNK